MRTSSLVLSSVVAIGAATLALVSGCAADTDPATSDSRESTDGLRGPGAPAVADEDGDDDDGDDESVEARCRVSRKLRRHDRCRPAPDAAPPPPAPDAGPAPIPDAGPAPTPDAGPAPTPDAGPAPAPSPTTCTSFTYSAWGTCKSDGTQTRTLLSSSPSGCTGGTPVLTQSCTYTPPVTTCTSFTYSAWSACKSSGTQTRSVLSSSPSGCTGGTPVLTQSCAYIDGAALYTQYCSGCHGTSKKGSSVSATQGAIDSNRGGMGSLSFLTPEQIAAISAAP